MRAVGNATRRETADVSDRRTEVIVATVTVGATDPGGSAVQSSTDGDVSVSADGVCVTVVAGAPVAVLR